MGERGEIKMVKEEVRIVVIGKNMRSCGGVDEHTVKDSDGRIRVVADPICVVDRAKDQGGGRFRLYGIETVIQKVCVQLLGVATIGDRHG